MGELVTFSLDNFNYQRFNPHTDTLLETNGCVDLNFIVDEKG